MRFRCATTSFHTQLKIVRTTQMSQHEQTDANCANCANLCNSATSRSQDTFYTQCKTADIWQHGKACVVKNISLQTSILFKCTYRVRMYTDHTCSKIFKKLLNAALKFIRIRAMSPLREKLSLVEFRKTLVFVIAIYAYNCCRVYSE